MSSSAIRPYDIGEIKPSESRWITAAVAGLNERLQEHFAREVDPQPYEITWDELSTEVSRRSSPGAGKPTDFIKEQVVTCFKSTGWEVAEEATLNVHGGHRTVNRGPGLRFTRPPYEEIFHSQD